MRPNFGTFYALSYLVRVLTMPTPMDILAEPQLRQQQLLTAKQLHGLTSQ
jgi:hypothetical protein